MGTAFRLIWQNPTLRMTMAGALLFGCYVATIAPYQSLIAIQIFGLTDAVYSLILVGSLIIAVIAAVGIGIITDQRPSRKGMALTASAATVCAAALVWLIPGKTSFIIAHVLIFPLSGTVFGQIFAVTRLASQTYAPNDRASIMAIIRALFAVPFVLILPVWGWAADQGMPLLTVYPGMLVFGVIQLLLFWRFWPSDGAAPWIEVKSGLGFRASLGEMLVWPVFLRVQLFGALQAGGALAGILVGLVFAEAGRGTTEVGIFFGAFVALEVVGTLLIGWCLRFAGRLTLIATGVLTYASFLALLPFLAPTPLVWLLVIPAGFGGGLFYTLVIAYLQDLLGTRAGAGASLLALGRIGQDLTGAGSFWLGTLLSGYGLAGILGALITSAAIGTVVLLDRQSKVPA